MSGGSSEIHDKEFKERKRAGNVIPVGSIIKCEICGKEIIKKGGLQRYCEKCAAKHLKEVDNQQSLAWKKENPEKPENIIEKMIIGRLNKELKEICLLDQAYVQDSDLTVAKYVEKVAKENNANVTVKRFVRFETGEGIEKKQEDFAAEVAAQMNA